MMCVVVIPQVSIITYIQCDLHRMLINFHCQPRPRVASQGCPQVGASIVNRTQASLAVIYFHCGYATQAFRTTQLRTNKFQLTDSTLMHLKEADCWLMRPTSERCQCACAQGTYCTNMVLPKRKLDTEGEVHCLCNASLVQDYPCKSYLRSPTKSNAPSPTPKNSPLDCASLPHPEGPPNNPTRRTFKPSMCCAQLSPTILQTRKNQKLNRVTFSSHARRCTMQEGR